MQKPLTITIVCDDQPGIVDKLAHVVSEHHGNWLESQLVQLKGKFAGVISIDVNDTHKQALSTALKALDTPSFMIGVDESNQSLSCKQRSRFSLSGPDKPGIVKEVTRALLQKGINVVKLTTSLSSMPYSGEPLFNVTGIIDIPKTEDDLADRFEEIADQLGMDFELSANNDDHHA